MGGAHAVLGASPAADRLEWVLDGLNGNGGWGGDADEVLAPGFTAAVPAPEFLKRTRRRAERFAPLEVIGLETGPNRARARIRVRDGGVHVVTCAVEPVAPHRITATMTTALVPEFTAPRLPADFTGSETPGTAPGTRVVVFSGLPGSRTRPGGGSGSRCSRWTGFWGH